MARPKKARVSRKESVIPAPVPIVTPEPEPVVASEPEDLGPRPYLRGMDLEKASFWEELSSHFEASLLSTHCDHIDSVDPDDLHRAVVLFFWRQSMLSRPTTLANHLAMMFVRNKRNLPI